MNDPLNRQYKDSGPLFRAACPTFYAHTPKAIDESSARHTRAREAFRTLLECRRDESVITSAFGTWVRDCGVPTHVSGILGVHLGIALERNLDAEEIVQMLLREAKAMGIFL